MFPKNLAVEANSAAMSELKSREDAKNHHKQEEINAAKALAEKLNGKSVDIKAKAGASGKLFGAVTSKEIVQQLNKDFGTEIDRKKMSVADIKSFGSYTAEIKLYTGIVAKITVNVTE